MERNQDAEERAALRALGACVAEEPDVGNNFLGDVTIINDPASAKEVLQPEPQPQPQPPPPPRRDTALSKFLRAGLKYGALVGAAGLGGAAIAITPQVIDALKQQPPVEAPIEQKPSYKLIPLAPE